MLRVGVVGCGTGGPAAALLLARAGHQVELLERFEDPAPIGAGILLQPTGMAVLRELGLLDAVLAQGARIARLHGETASGRPVLDLSYADLQQDLFGLGIHRGALFGELWDALVTARIPVRVGVEGTGLRRRGREVSIVDASGGEHGPYDLVVAADGARSGLRHDVHARARVSDYPWGALWAILRDEQGRFDGALAQRYRGTREMLGYLPLGRSPRVAGDTRLVSLFWSLRCDGLEAWRRDGLAAWKSRVLALDGRAAELLDQIADPDGLLFASYRDVRLRDVVDDRVALIGDAAHAMSPQLGQGVNLALLDARSLAREVGDGRDLPAALRRHHAARRANVRFYAWASRWLTPFFQSDLGMLGPPRDLLTHPASRIGWYRRQMLESLAGAKGGLLTSTEI